MRLQHQASQEVCTAAETPAARRDSATAAIVRKGITLQQIHGTRYAADFLNEKKVDLEIVMRVLLNLSAQRRHDDAVEYVDPSGEGGAQLF